MPTARPSRDGSGFFIACDRLSLSLGIIPMSDYQLKPAVDKNTQDIQALTKSLVELAASVRVLAEGQKDLGDLVRSQVEHNLEIQSLKQSLRDLHGVMNKAHERVEVLEAHRLSTIAANKARSGLVEKLIRYAP